VSDQTTAQLSGDGESLPEWLARVGASPPLCECGCGGSVGVSARHRAAGLPRFRPGHHARCMETRSAREKRTWMEAESGRHICECGCGGVLTIKPQHRWSGIPRFIPGHHSRAGLGHYKGVDKWVRENSGKHSCACGCGLPVNVRKAHFRAGIPRYRHHHGNRPHVRDGGTSHPAYKQYRAGMLPHDADPVFRSTRRLLARIFDFCCAWCGVQELLDIDHIVPVAQGGRSTIENLQPLCPTCHRWKSGITLTARELRNPSGRTDWKRRSSCP